jgi:hypothetical protein
MTPDLEALVVAAWAFGDEYPVARPTCLRSCCSALRAGRGISGTSRRSASLRERPLAGPVFSKMSP